MIGESTNVLSVQKLGHFLLFQLIFPQGAVSTSVSHVMDVDDFGVVGGYS